MNPPGSAECETMPMPMRRPPTVPAAVQLDPTHLHPPAGRAWAWGAGRRCPERREAGEEASPSQPCLACTRPHGRRSRVSRDICVPTHQPALRAGGMASKQRQLHVASCHVSADVFRGMAMLCRTSFFFSISFCLVGSRTTTIRGPLRNQTLSLGLNAAVGVGETGQATTSRP